MAAKEVKFGDSARKKMLVGVNVLADAVKAHDAEKAVEAGKFSAGQNVDRAALVEAGLIRVNGAPARILGKGEIKTALNLSVHSASAAAKAAVEAAGGSVTVEAKAEEAEA